ncbi:hypothetical protein ACLOJK_012958 [Asimina triloba]
MESFLKNYKRERDSTMKKKEYKACFLLRVKRAVTILDALPPYSLVVTWWHVLIAQRIFLERIHIRSSYRRQRFLYKEVTELSIVSELSTLTTPSVIPTPLSFTNSSSRTIAPEIRAPQDLKRAIIESSPWPLW